MWEKRNPGYKGRVGTTVVDLGVGQRVGNRASPNRSERCRQAVFASGRIAKVNIAICQKATYCH